MQEEYVVGIGELLWDMLPDGRRLGGAPANFAYHVSQFGLDSVVASAVGMDEPGDAALGELKGKCEVLSVPDGKAVMCPTASSSGPLAVIARVDFPTGTVDIDLDAAGIPQYDIRMPAAWDNIPWTPVLRQLASRTRAVCFGTLARRSPVSCRTISDFVDAVPSGEGRYRIFDINLRQHFYSEDIIVHALRQCNVLKINDEELDIVSGMLSLSGDGYPERCRSLMNRFDIGILILTCGVRGSYVFSSSAGDVSFFGTPKVKVADTVGAGDSFTAAFTAGLIKGLPVIGAHRLAVDVSAYVCTRQGAMPVLPDSFRQRLHP